jgi:hypothetical protein
MNNNQLGGMTPEKWEEVRHGNEEAAQKIIIAATSYKDDLEIKSVAGPDWCILIASNIVPYVLPIAIMEKLSDAINDRLANGPKEQKQ